MGLATPELITVFDDVSNLEKTLFSLLNYLSQIKPEPDGDCVGCDLACITMDCPDRED